MDRWKQDICGGVYATLQNGKQVMKLYKGKYYTWERKRSNSSSTPLVAFLKKSIHPGAGTKKAPGILALELQAGPGTSKFLKCWKRFTGSWKFCHVWMHLQYINYTKTLALLSMWRNVTQRKSWGKGAGQLYFNFSLENSRVSEKGSLVPDTLVIHRGQDIYNSVCAA